MNTNPPIHVNFYDLEPFDFVSSFKSCCPVCAAGVLTMHRYSGSGELMAEDVCCLCGQRVVYDDIARVRLEHGRHSSEGI